MTTVHVTKALLALAALALPASAAALNATAHAGLGYWQSDSWSAGGAHSRAPHLDIDLSLRLTGAIASKEVVDYMLTGSYRRIRDHVDGIPSDASDLFTYSARADVLRNPTSPVTLSVHASRSDSSFATDPARDIFGEAVTDSYGGTVFLTGHRRPAVHAGYGFTRVEQTIPDMAPFETSAHSVASSVSFGNEAFAFEGAYDGQFREGAFVADRYDSHYATALAKMQVGAKSALTVESVTNMTTPPELVPGAYEQQTSAVRAHLSTMTERARTASYTYARTLTEAATLLDREHVTQGMSYAGDHLLTRPDLFTRWLANVSLTETRLGTEEVTATGETIGVELWWRPTRGESKYELRAGPLVGLIQSDETGDDEGYGGRGAVRMTRPLWSHTFRLEYSGEYGTNLFASGGWRLTQSASASLGGTMKAARFNASVQATAFRTWLPLVGDGAGRVIEGSFKAGFRRMELEVRGSLRNGIVGATPTEFMGDGLLVPAPFNSSTMNVSFGMTAKLLTGLSGALRGRYGSSDVPGRPVLSQAEAQAALTYTYAGFGTSLQDRISWYEREGGWDRVNRFTFQVHRSFAW